MHSFTSDSIVTLATPFSSAAGLALSFATSASVPVAAPPLDATHFSPYAPGENEYLAPYFYPPFPFGGPMFPASWSPQEGYAFPVPPEYDVPPPPSASYPFSPPIFTPFEPDSIDQELRPTTPPAPPHTANAFHYPQPHFAPPGPGVLYHSQSFPNLPLMHHHQPLFSLPSAFDHSDRAPGATCPAKDDLGSGGAGDDAASTCGRDLFCTFYPCGCSTCRDHYNVVVTHGRDVPAGEDAPHKRIFTCAVCGKRSEKICPLSTRGHFEHHAGPSVQQTSSSPIRLKERPSMDRIQEDAPTDENDEIIGTFGVTFHRVPGRDLSYFSDDYPPFAPELTPLLPYAFPGPPPTTPLASMSLLPALAPPFYPSPPSFNPQLPPSPTTSRPRIHTNSPSQPLKHPLPNPPTQRAPPLPSQASLFLASGHAPANHHGHGHHRPRAASSPGARTTFPSMSLNPKRSPTQPRLPPRSTPSTPASMRSLSLSPEIGTQRWNDPRGPKTEPSEPYQLQPNVWPIIKVENVGYPILLAESDALSTPTRTDSVRDDRARPREVAPAVLPSVKAERHQCDPHHTSPVSLYLYISSFALESRPAPFPPKKTSKPEVRKLTRCDFVTQHDRTNAPALLPRDALGRNGARDHQQDGPPAARGSHRSHQVGASRRAHARRALRSLGSPRA